MGANPPRVFTDHFETMGTCSTSSVNVHLVLGLSSLYFLSFFLLFFLLSLFPGSISIIIDTLWAQLILKLCILVLHCLKMSMRVWAYPPITFMHFCTVSTEFVPGPISIRINIL